MCVCVCVRLYELCAQEYYVTYRVKLKFTKKSVEMSDSHFYGVSEDRNAKHCNTPTMVT